MRPSAVLLPSLALLSSLASGLSLSPHRAAAAVPEAPPLPAFLPSRRPASASGTGTGTALRASRGDASASPPETALAASLMPSSGGASRPPDTVPLALGPADLLASLWGTGGFCYILLRSIRKIAPIALEPFWKGTAEAAVPLSRPQLALYAATCLYFAYVEGYKGFQLKFSPLVVSRSLTLRPLGGGSGPVRVLLAPLYSMGLFHASRRRLVVSWSVTLGVAAVVAAVKRMPYPYRNIVDAGVVVGLTWGMLSIVASYVGAVCVRGTSPCDPCLPEEKAP